MTTEIINEDSNVVGGGEVAIPEKPLDKPKKRKSLEEKVLEAFESAAEIAFSKILFEGARWDPQVGWKGGGTDERHPGWDPMDPRAPHQQSRDWLRGKFGGKKDHVKYYYSVPFAKKDEAKKLGLRWDPTKKLWFSYTSEDSIGPFKRDKSAHSR